MIIQRRKTMAAEKKFENKIKTELHRRGAWKTEKGEMIYAYS